MGRVKLGPAVWLQLPLQLPRALLNPAPTATPGPAAPSFAECSMMHHALLAGDVLLRGSDNLQPDEAACCRSCLSHAGGCTAWVYCPNEGGCSAASSNVTLVRRDSGAASAPTEEEQLRQLQLPHQGCRLLSIAAFRLRKDSPQILAKGPGVEFISGASWQRGAGPDCVQQQQQLRACRQQLGVLGIGRAGRAGRPLAAP